MPRGLDILYIYILYYYTDDPMQAKYITLSNRFNCISLVYHISKNPHEFVTRHFSQDRSKSIDNIPPLREVFRNQMRSEYKSHLHP